MHRVLLSEPRIGSYSAFLLLGLLGGYLLARWSAPRAGIKASHIDNLALLTSVLGLFGARLFSWLFYFPPGISLWSALTDSSGGMVFYGGVVFGILTVVIYAKLSGMRLGNLLDVFAPGLALGLAIGRIGCFMAGCCWGDICTDSATLAKLPDLAAVRQVHTIPWISSAGFPLAVRFPEGAGAVEQHRKLGLIDAADRLSLPVHPVQLYEAALALALCILLHWHFAKRRWQGQIFCWLILGYATIRFGTELLRADNPPIYFGLTLSQVISLTLGTVGVALLAIRSWPRLNTSAAGESEHALQIFEHH